MNKLEIDQELKKQQESDFPLIPMCDIDDEARIIAVRWGDKYFAGFGVTEKHKLASDFMNYARRVREKKNKIRGCTKDKSEKHKAEYYMLLYGFLKSDDPKHHVFYNEQYQDLTNLEKDEFNGFILKQKTENKTLKNN